jgi:flagellar motor switch protein FliG
MSTIRQSTTRETPPPAPPPKRLNGPEKVAILLLCLGEERGSAVMQLLDEAELQRIGRAMSGLGPIPAELAEAVLAEFRETVMAGGVPPDTFEAARKMLGSFMPDEKVDEMLGSAPAPARSETGIWQRINQMDERVLARHFDLEKVSTVAMILSCLSPDFTARILPLMEETKMLRVIEWMTQMKEPPDHLMKEIEAALQMDVWMQARIPKALGLTSAWPTYSTSSIRPCLKPFPISCHQSIPVEFSAIRKRMFTFGDLARIGGQDIARVMRGMTGNTVPLALKGSGEEMRQHFLNALPARSRDMLTEEIEALGPVRARDVRDAQNAMVDYALELIRADVIKLPDENADEEELID